METVSALLALCCSRSPVNSPHKSQWSGALFFTLICAWINGWVNNREAGDLRRHYRAHYNVTVMCPSGAIWRHKSGSTSSSGNGLLPDSTQQISKLMLTSVAFVREQLQIIPYINASGAYTFKITTVFFQKPESQWNLSVTTTSKIKFITCDLFSNVF